MAALHQFDYIFALAMLFAFLDAWNIGANDVANSFATSVSSRALKYWQAMILAAICEFLGAVLAGARVTDTIRNKIIDVDPFTETPAGLMLLMMCALVGSSVWLTIATKLGIPVSTTHSIVGAVIGAAIATNGGGGVHWGWEGFSKIVASWFIAPAIAGGFAALIYLITKYVVLERKHALRNALWMGYLYVGVTFGVLTMLIVWKGAPNLKLDKLSTGATVGSIIGVGAVAALLYGIFLQPFFWRKLVKEDHSLRVWDVLYGPFLYYRGDVPPMPEGMNRHDYVVDYYQSVRSKEEYLEYYGHLNGYEGDDLTEDEEQQILVVSSNPEKSNGIESVESEEVEDGRTNANRAAALESVDKSWKVLARSPKNWPLLFWKAISHGWTVDVISAQKTNGNALSGDLRKMFSKAKKYDNKVEALYSFLQCVTACTASFAHGSNDISNAVGPLTTIYQIWSTNTAGKKADVPVWILVYASVALVIGLWTYGYNLMSNLGNKMTMQSPSRGFSMEFGAAVTTIMATRLNLPISTTQCIVGAIVAVGLCNGTIKAVNWRMVAWCYFGWIFTVPFAGLIAGILMGIISNAPKLGEVYTMS